MKNKIGLFICLGMMSSCSYAMSISNLMLINSDAGKGTPGVYTISNTDNMTYFLKTSVSKIEVKENKVVKIPYTRENLNAWEIVPKPSKLVMKPKIDKQLMIEEVCGDKCDNSKDRVYQVNIEPVSYKASGENESKVSMLFGYSPYYVIPAAKSHMDYTLGYDGHNLLVKNTGNTLMKVIVDQCNEKSPEELLQIEQDDEKRCSVNYTVIAGRDRKLRVPEEMRQNSLSVVVLNHDESYRDEETVRLNQ